ncbi:bifunctional folylpolyglutamate synthase/dihydrofolate synthase [Psychroflexus montanilacus]|uniref:bifunctional folylpolyglutamate synthase/dihydrofolate synthase n=1 Tax=Psychroflexus montanilacus TaxID=2873598 RepID=UPI001CCE3EED|nr:folylpolyglutamate synthase/dihydrofolate synthase family protein [Psychroflexus montanilacus]MBZ9652383.1 bifunctional folylpolyglutamate synthase/dihydrofolate synthase [Psychroflexus montanilacus]
MTYTETLHWMFEQLPMYQRQGKTAFKKDLTNTLALAKTLGNPEQKFKSIHVAGTNGKGSVSHMLASVLQTAGYKVGLYTSPHLKDFRERIKINGEQISKANVIEFISEHKAFLEAQKLSFFEMTVGMAFDYFASQNIDIAIVEVGMGGRLDSTNIITPLLSVITNIGFDHTAFLGNTLDLIAGEKAGIIKKNIPVVIGETLPETKPVFTKKAEAENATLFFAEELNPPLPKCDLMGNYQKCNLKTCLKALEVLNTIDEYKITKAQIKKGLAEVKLNTKLRGRWEILGEAPKIIADTAHNKEGLSLVLEQVFEEKYKDLHIVLGFVNDKDLDTILPLFPATAKYYFSKPDVPRGLEATELYYKAKAFSLYGKAFTTIDNALKAAQRDAQKEDLIYVGGSTFTVAEIL